MEISQDRKTTYNIQQALSHRDLRNILIYINIEKALFLNTDDETHLKVAHRLDKACKLLEACLNTLKK